ncbi:MAG: alpha/beta fold hydrolase [Sandaracinus sp.]
MHTFVPTRAGALAVESFGQGAPLLLLHSGGHDRHDYDGVVPALSRRFRVVTLDLPGHGDSAPIDAEGFGVARILEGVGDAVRALDLPPALVFGNSVGGTAALHLAATMPARVRGLVLISTSGLVERTALARAFCRIQGIEWVRRHLGMAFARSYVKSPSPITDAILARMAVRRRDPGFVAREAALWRSFGQPESDLAPLVSRIACPTALVWGQRDPVLRAHVEGARARRLLPHARWVPMGSGHLPHAEEPAAFLAAIEPFLSELDAAHAGATSARA